MTKAHNKIYTILNEKLRSTYRLYMKKYKCLLCFMGDKKSYVWNNTKVSELLFFYSFLIRGSSTKC